MITLFIHIHIPFNQSINQSISLFQAARPIEKKQEHIYTYKHTLTHTYKIEKTITQKTLNIKAFF